MSLDRLKLGISAIKFHYSKQVSKDCTLKVSEDGRILYWIYNHSNLSSEFMKRYIELE
jgi:hypothetical protein